MIHIKRLNHKGQGIAYNKTKNKELRIWNALPDELVKMKILKKKRGIREGNAIKVENPSEHRIAPEEPNHYLSCSPLQMMSFEFENRLKLKVAKNKFKDLKNFTDNFSPEKLEIVRNKDQYNYRNKMEFSFYGHDSFPPDKGGLRRVPEKRRTSLSSKNKENSSIKKMSAAESRNIKTPLHPPYQGDSSNPPLSRGEHISLAFHVRGTKRGKIPIKGCKLAENVINATAEKIVNWINTERKDSRHTFEARDLKTLILRSDSNDHCVAALFLKKEITFKKYPELEKNFVGFHIYYSDPKSPASKPTRLLYQEGKSCLETQINKVNLTFGPNSFFQINIPIFQMALTRIEYLIDKNDDVIDLYSGVGAISLPIHQKFKSCQLIEMNEEAVKFANKNIKKNKIKNCEAILSRAEDITEVIKPNSTLILDPPREGLHKNVIKAILENKPKKIIYISCNINSQIEDIKKLKDIYSINFAEIYNFFPRTPHFESLCVLEI